MLSYSAIACFMEFFRTWLHERRETYEKSNHTFIIILFNKYLIVDYIFNIINKKYILKYILYI